MIRVIRLYGARGGKGWGERGGEKKRRELQERRVDGAGKNRQTDRKTDRSTTGRRFASEIDRETERERKGE